MSMLPMPECMKNFLNSLTREEKTEVARWVDYGCCCAEADIREALKVAPSSQRAVDLFAQQRSDFMEAARDSVIISTCLQIARQNNMWIGFAWLSACMALLGQNKALTENAQALVANRALPEMIFGEKESPEAMREEQAVYRRATPDQGAVCPTMRFPNEGYAELRCGGTSIRLTYTDLHLICGWLAVGSAEASDLYAASKSALLPAINNVACEASLGRTPKP